MLIAYELHDGTPKYKHIITISSK